MTSDPSTTNATDDTSAATTLKVRRAHERFHTDIGWLDSWHSFSFGNHYHPNELGHGLLIVSNDDRVAPGGGFGAHPHQNMEIVTWVLDGKLEHEDSAGNHGILYPGLAQRMSAGTGIVHSEHNASTTEAVHFVQMWVVPSKVGVEPGYEQTDVNDALAKGGWVPVASGKGHAGAVHLHQEGAVMYVARMTADETLDVPKAPNVHLFVAKGTVAVGDATYNAGDALRVTGEQALAVTAVESAELIVWATDAPTPRR